MVEVKETIEKINRLKPYLPGKTQEELDKILVYGEEKKVEGKRKKQEFWSAYSRKEFYKLLKYKRKHKEQLEGEYEYLNKMNAFEKSKFVEEYLFDDMLYKGNLDEKEPERHYYSNGDWIRGEVIMQDRIRLKLDGDEYLYQLAKALSSGMKLKEGVWLTLEYNNMGDELLKKIIENVKLEKWVELSLRDNDIGPEGAKAICKRSLK